MPLIATGNVAIATYGTPLSKLFFVSASKLVTLFMNPSVLLTVLAFSWTSYPDEIYIPDDALEMDEDIEVEPPRTAEPPPPLRSEPSMSSQKATAIYTEY